MKNTVTFLLAFTILALSAPAWAHVYLDHADPRVGADLDKPPTEVRIWFTGEVDLPGSTLQVLGPDGKQIDKADIHAGPDAKDPQAKDRKLLVVSLPDKLPAGAYKVVWQATSSADGHKTNGDFTFTVKPAK